VPFYRFKGTIYNVWFIGVSILYFRTRLALEDSHVYRGTTTCLLYDDRHVAAQPWGSSKSLSAH
jgi:hypothetical protein